MNLPKLLQMFRAGENGWAAAEIHRLAEAAEAIARPKAIYKLGFIEEKGPDYVVVDGVKFTSRVMRVNLDGAQRIFAYVCTSGQEIEAWAESQEDLLARFWADGINQMVLSAAMTSLTAHLAERFAVGPTSAMNPGSLADWPLKEQRVLFRLLGDVQGAIGVELTDSLLMVPTKSVSGIFFPTEESFASCQLCPREGCPNRRAAYDPGLYERKYR
jgi:hypothetical protein